MIYWILMSLPEVDLIQENHRICAISVLKPNMCFSTVLYNPQAMINKAIRLNELNTILHKFLSYP